MAIPALNESGLLPDGVHTCTTDELHARFGSFQTSDQRPRLMRQLEAFLAEVKASGIVKAVIVNGSFVTSKEVPNDVDLLLVLPVGHDFRADLGPAQYMVVNRRRVKRVHGLDLFVVQEESADYAALVRRSSSACACNPD
jgi:hypothetical protein